MEELQHGIGCRVANDQDAGSERRRISTRSRLPKAFHYKIKDSIRPICQSKTPEALLTSPRPSVSALM